MARQRVETLSLLWEHNVYEPALSEYRTNGYKLDKRGKN